MSDLTKQVLLDANLDSYQSFFDHDWAQNLDQLARGTPLEQVVFDLIAAWKAAALTHRLPWLTVQFFKSFAREFVKSRDSLTKMFVEAFVRDISNKTPSLRHMQRKEVIEAVQGIYKTIGEPAETAVSEHVLDAFWKRVLGDFEFNGSIWASQRLCFCALYYAYEDFLVRVYQLVSGNPKYRLRTADMFGDDFEKAFSKSLRDLCFSGDVNIARLVRNAFAHNGGRETDPLRAEKHSYHIAGGEIQIVPAQTKALFDLLKDRATRVVVETVPQLPPPKK